MGQFKIPGTSVVYSNPEQQDQNTLFFPNSTRVWQQELTQTQQPLSVGIGYGWMSIPQPNSFDATPPEANPILVNQQPAPLTRRN
jgi:hypothetical protein